MALDSFHLPPRNVLNGCEEIPSTTDTSMPDVVCNSDMLDAYFVPLLPDPATYSAYDSHDAYKLTYTQPQTGQVAAIPCLPSPSIRWLTHHSILLRAFRQQQIPDVFKIGELAEATGYTYEEIECWFALTRLAFSDGFQNVSGHQTIAGSFSHADKKGWQGGEQEVSRLTRFNPPAVLSPDYDSSPTDASSGERFVCRPIPHRSSFQCVGRNDEGCGKIMQSLKSLCDHEKAHFPKVAFRCNLGSCPRPHWIPKLANAKSHLKSKGYQAAELKRILKRHSYKTPYLFHERCGFQGCDFTCSTQKQSQDHIHNHQKRGDKMSFWKHSCGHEHMYKKPKSVRGASAENEEEDDGYDYEHVCDSDDDDSDDRDDHDEHGDDNTSGSGFRQNPNAKRDQLQHQHSAKGKATGGYSIDNSNRTERRGYAPGSVRSATDTALRFSIANESQQTGGSLTRCQLETTRTTHEPQDLHSQAMSSRQILSKMPADEPDEVQAAEAFYRDEQSPNRLVSHTNNLADNVRTASIPLLARSRLRRSASYRSPDDPEANEAKSATARTPAAFQNEILVLSLRLDNSETFNLEVKYDTGSSLNLISEKFAGKMQPRRNEDMFRSTNYHAWMGRRSSEKLSWLKGCPGSGKRLMDIAGSQHIPQKSAIGIDSLVDPFLSSFVVQEKRHADFLRLVAFRNREKTSQRQMLIRAGVDAEDRQCGTGLYEAALVGHSECITRLSLDESTFTDALVEAEARYFEALLSRAAIESWPIAALILATATDGDVLRSSNFELICGDHRRNYTRRVMQILVDAGAYVDASGRLCKSAGLVKAIKDRESMIRMLLAVGADVNDGQESYQMLPLTSLTAGFNSALRVLWRAWTAVNAKGGILKTTRQAALRRGFVKALELLLARQCTSG